MRFSPLFVGEVVGGDVAVAVPVVMRKFQSPLRRGSRRWRLDCTTILRFFRDRMSTKGREPENEANGRGVLDMGLLALARLFLSSEDVVAEAAQLATIAFRRTIGGRGKLLAREHRADPACDVRRRRA